MFLKPRSGREPCPVLALADDLSGAAETAAALCLRAGSSCGPRRVASPPWRRPSRVRHSSSTSTPGSWMPVRPPSIVRETVRDMARTPVRGAVDDTVLIKKTDSLLRGNLAAEAAAYAQGAEGLADRPRPAGGRTDRV